jgi:hypothetical protein
MKAKELEDLRILNEAKTKKADEKKERKVQKKLNKDQSMLC